MPDKPNEVDANVLMQQIGQFMLKAIQYAQRDTNVARAAQDSPLAPGTSFGAPADLDSLPGEVASVRPVAPVTTASLLPQADHPQPPRPIRKDETWAEYHGIASIGSDEIQKLREQVVQEAKRRQSAMLQRDVHLLSGGPDPFRDEPPAPMPAEMPTITTPPPRQAPRPQTVVRQPPVPNSGDEWGNWQNTLVDTVKTTGTDNKQPDATKLGSDLRTQLDRMNRDLTHILGQLTKSIIKINERLEQIEAGFESQEAA